MGSYKFNATGTFPDPTETQWIDRSEKGVSGDGHSIYPLPRKFQLKWDFMTMDDFKTLQDLYNTVQSTGTFVATLPQYGQPWGFYSYTGCTMKEPSMGAFFETYVSDVTVLVVNVIT